MLKDELANGVEIYQVTQGNALVSNLYCERPYSSLDSRRFLYARQRDDAGSHDRQHGDLGPAAYRKAPQEPGQDRLCPWEYVLCEFGTWEEEVVGAGFLQVSVSYGDDFYFQRPEAKGQLELVRLDMATGVLEPVWLCSSDTGYVGHPTVSTDRKWLAYHYPLSYSPQRFGVALVDLQTGERNVIYEHPHLCNAHLQFHPTDNRTLLVQLNRGCEYTSDGERLKLVGDEGATLLLLDAISGEVEPLLIGKPYTPPITGHEAWLGTSREVVATVIAEGEYVAAPTKGSVVVIAEGTPCRQLGTGIELIHIGSTPGGQYIYGDCIAEDYITIVSPVTGKTVTVHRDPEQPGDSPYDQQSHPHAYLTPDFNWMVFNSDCTGRPQVYAARIPSELLAEVDNS